MKIKICRLVIVLSILAVATKNVHAYPDYWAYYTCTQENSAYLCGTCCNRIGTQKALACTTTECIREAQDYVRGCWSACDGWVGGVQEICSGSGC